MGSLLGNLVAILVILLLVIVAVYIIVRNKKRGNKCLGCPSCGNCYGDCKKDGK